MSSLFTRLEKFVTIIVCITLIMFVANLVFIQLLGIHSLFFKALIVLLAYPLAMKLYRLFIDDNF